MQVTDGTTESRDGRSLFPVLGSGAVAGAIGGFAMGGAARFAMRIFAVDVGHEPAFTVGGTAAILTFGLLIGAGFGMGYGTLRKVLPGPWPVPGVTFATILFLFIQVPVFTAGIDEAAPDPGLGFRLFLPVTLLFVLMTALAMSALERRFASSVAQPNGLWSGAILLGVFGLLLIVGPILSSYGQLLGALGS
jgi:hypothetical protein